MSLCTIVGMGPGLGLSIARVFAQEGFEIAMIARNEDRLRNYAGLLEGYGTIISYAAADAGDSDQLRQALSRFETDVFLLSDYRTQLA